MIADFCRRNGVRKFAFFGSMLTDRFSDESDIDVLVEFRPAERVGFFRLAEMEEELSRLFGSRKVDLRTPADLSVYFRDEVVRNALVAYVEP
ncbi:MAG: nucleotidyltransferase domain-containing protein [Acidobacteria bacterium]|nr:nucleotidyltransferase domain-containing protein [Acidobacteriota bacterium]